MAITRSVIALVDSRSGKPSIPSKYREFAYSVAHDLKAPIRAVRGYAELLESRLEELQLADRLAGDCINEIESGCSKMEELIQGFLSLAEVESSTPDELVDLNEVVKDASSLLNAQLFATDGAIRVVGDLPIVRGSRPMLGTLFQNLFSNSIKYRSAKRTPVVEVRCTDCSEHGCTIAVKDNGIGFTPAQQEGVFELFKRLCPEHAGGFGLGLTICRRVVEKHGGSITAIGHLDDGATFFVSLPKAWHREDVVM